MSTIYNIREVLQTLVHYYDFTRQVGHTTAMMKGAGNVDSTILVWNEHMRDHIKKLFPSSKNDYITIGGLNNLRSMKKPLALDNAAIHMVLLNALNRITELEQEVKEYLKVKTFIDKTIAPTKKSKKKK